MKRFIFSAIALAVTATACTESGLIDTPEMYGSEIVFDTYIGKAPTTKAESVDLSYLEGAVENNGGAQVYAFKCEDGNNNPADIDFTDAFMNGRIVCVEPTSGTTYGTWAYQEYYKLPNANEDTWNPEDVYWPGDVDLAFVAYNLAAKDNKTIETESIGNLEFDFTIDSQVSDQVDLLVTPLTFVSENNSGDTYVGLTFHHLLSRVGFSVVATSENDDVQIAIRSLKLNGTFPTKGKVNLTTVAPAIEAYATPTTTGYNLFADGQCFTVSSDTENSAIYANKKYDSEGEDWDAMYLTPAANEFTPNPNDRFMMLMPGQVDNATIDVTYQLSQALPNTVNVPLGNIDLKPGRAYEFVLKVATAAIEFSGVLEGDWGTPEEKPIY